MKKILLSLICLIVVFTITGCGSDNKNNNSSTNNNSNNKKKTLQKIKIEEIPYLNSKMHHTYSYSDSIGNKVTFTMSSNSNCLYASTMKNGSSTIFKSNYETSDCSYSISNNSLAINVKVYNTNSRSNEDLSINGTIDETGKELKLVVDGKEYKLFHTLYKALIDKNIGYALYDPETTEVYDLEGLSILELITEDGAFDYVQLDLSKYEIK